MYTKSSISITKPSASNCADFIGFPIGPTPCSRQRPRKHEMNRHSPKKYDEAKSKNKMYVSILPGTAQPHNISLRDAGRGHTPSPSKADKSESLTPPKICLQHYNCFSYNKFQDHIPEIIDGGTPGPGFVS